MLAKLPPTAIFAVDDFVNLLNLSDEVRDRRVHTAAQLEGCPTAGADRPAVVSRTPQPLIFSVQHQRGNNRMADLGPATQLHEQFKVRFCDHGDDQEQPATPTRSSFSLYTDFLC